MFASAARLVPSYIPCALLGIVLFASTAVHAQETTAPPTTPAVAPQNTPAGATDVVSALPLTGPVRKLDVLRVVVAGSDLGGLVRVENDGTVSLPRLGQITVARKEIADAARLIAARIEERKLLRQADVAVYIVGRKTEEVTIYGAVLQQGRLPLREDMVLSDAVETAGTQPTADLSRVVITRRADTEKVRPNDRITATPRDITIDYRQFRTGSSRDVQYNPPLRDGDRIFIYQLVPATAGTIRLTGEVKDSTKVVLPIVQGDTATQVLQAAGGLSENADRNRIVVLRTGTDGRQSRLPVAYDSIVGGDRSRDVVLQRGDEISVPRAGHPQVISVTGAVREGKSYPYRSGITLQEAISEAGGPIEGARQDSIEVRRQVANAQLETRKYDMKKDSDAASVLQEGDTVFVPYARRRESISIGTVIAALSGLAILFSALRR